MRDRVRFVTSIFVFAGLALAVGTVGAETLACRPVLRVPITIPAPGIYCLTRNLASAATSGAAITVAANDVVLDLNGWTLDGSAAGPATEAVGISAIDRANVTLKNGTVRGFQTGIQLATVSRARGNIVERIRADHNTLVGIVAGGEGVIVRDNLVLDTGGSTAPAPIGGLRSSGITAFLAPGSVIRGNQVVGTTAEKGSYAYDIWAANSNGVLIEGNVVRHPAISPSFSYGILVPFSQNAQVVNNRIADVQIGVEYSSGATGKYRDNLTDGVATPFAGTGTDAGGNF